MGSHPGFRKNLRLFIPGLIIILFSGCQKSELSTPPLAPEITSTTPVANAADQPFQQTISVVFSQVMDTTSVAHAMKLKSGSQEVPGYFSFDHKKVEFIPHEELLPNTTYSVVVGKDAKSTSGGILSSEYVINFTTKGPDTYTMTKTSGHVTDFERDGSRVMQVGNYMYSFGGWSNPPETSHNDIYRSQDLITWEKRPDAPWHGRHVFGVAKLNGATYVIGGDNLQPTFDVWRTFDGENWVLLSSDVLSNRVFYGCTAHNGFLYVVGGADLNDVWKSPDGINWTKVSDNISFLNGENFAGSLTSFNGKLWMICGGGTGGGAGDPRKSVWTSTDGVVWNQEPDFAGSKRYYTDLCVWDNKIWVVGGYNDEEGNVKSIWYMNRKGEWTEMPTHDDYIARHATGVGVFNNRLVITCGSYHNDCWVIDKVH